MLKDCMSRWVRRSLASLPCLHEPVTAATTDSDCHSFSPRTSGLPKRRVNVLRACLLAASAVCVSAVMTFTVAAQTCAPGINDGTTNGANSTFLGPNVYVITPNMWTCDIQSLLNTLNQEAQFSTNRYAVLFAPGTYGSTSLPLTAQVGYYEQIAGLGATPQATQITGGFYVNQIVLDSNGNSTGLTQNFWRSQENMSVTPTGGPTNGTLDWGVSQGASLRRMQINGNLWYANSTPVPNSPDACAEASGGFTADTQITGTTNFCSQQQWYIRNSEMDGAATSYVWNFVFTGDTGNGVPQQSFPGGAGGDANVTVLPETPVSIEKPFLQIDNNGYDEGDYSVWVPMVQSNSSGTSWSQNPGSNGYAEPMSDFFIATPSTSVDDINEELLAGYNLILTPGIYQYTEPIHVTNPWTVVLGLGFPTIVPQAGNPAIVIDDVDAVQLAGVIVDAGPVTSPVLVEVGKPGVVNQTHDYPTSLHDVYFRIGGGTQGSANVSLQVDSNDVILDNIWAWRADHGNPGTFGWTINTANTGLIVNGENVYALGLAVEHYQQDQVVWNGDSGGTIFYQSEEPYDVPNQAAWMNPSGGNGYPSYNVSPGVCSHYAYGLGVYSYFDQGQNIVDDTAIQVPASEFVYLQGLSTVFLNGSGQISSIVDGQGSAANSGDLSSPQQMQSFSGSTSCTPFSEPAGSTVVPGLIDNTSPGYSNTTSTNYNPENYSSALIMQEIENPHADLSLVVAHRGLHALVDGSNPGVPENSLESIGLAAQAGIEMVEVDIKLTSDGVPILSHDQNWGRETCGRYGAGIVYPPFNPFLPQGSNSTNDSEDAPVSSVSLSRTRWWYWDNTSLRDTISLINNDYEVQGCSSGAEFSPVFAPTLQEVLNYMTKNKISMVLTLDIKDQATAAAAWNVVANSKDFNGNPYYDSVLFKIAARNFTTPTAVANTFTASPGPSYARLFPYFGTANDAPGSFPNYDQNNQGGDVPIEGLINDYESNPNVHISALEVNQKQPYGNLWEAALYATTSANTFTPVRVGTFSPYTEYNDPNNPGVPEFFSKYGYCAPCEQLSDYFYTGPPMADTADLRGSTSFIMNPNDFNPTSTPFSIITADNALTWINFLQGEGLRNICYMQTTGCTQVTGNLVINPEFALNLSGWQVSTNDNNSLLNGGDEDYEGLWDTVPYQTDLQQVINGLPNGTYTLSAWEADSGGENSANMWTWSAAGSTSINLAGSGNWTYIQIPNVTVSNGQVYVGFWVDANANDWVELTDVSLTQN